MVEITKREYWKIVGLLTLSSKLMEQLSEIEESLQDSTREEEEGCHCVDAIYSNYTAEELLEKLNIKVI